MKIENCVASDIDEIFRLYKIASDYQKSKQIVVVWPEFKGNLLKLKLLKTGNGN